MSTYFLYVAITLPKKDPLFEHTSFYPRISCAKFVEIGSEDKEDKYRQTDGQTSDRQRVIRKATLINQRRWANIITVIQETEE